LSSDPPASHDDWNFSGHGKRVFASFFAINPKLGGRYFGGAELVLCPCKSEQSVALSIRHAPQQDPNLRPIEPLPIFHRRETASETLARLVFPGNGQSPCPKRESHQRRSKGPARR
jgi:hypothetical protein